MSKPPRVLVTKERDVHTYAELWHASHCVLEKGRADPEGSTWQFLSSMLLTAFSFEAYLNHVGSTLFSQWHHLERLPPWSKFELISEKLELSFPAGQGARPLQTISKLLDFRNTMAHGRSHQITAKPVEKSVDTYHHAFAEELLSDWETLIRSDDFARRARQDLEAVLNQIHSALPEPKEVLFSFGLGMYSATLIESS